MNFFKPPALAPKARRCETVTCWMMKMEKVDSEEQLWTLYCVWDSLTDCPPCKKKSHEKGAGFVDGIAKEVVNSFSSSTCECAGNCQTSMPIECKKSWRPVFRGNEKDTRKIFEVKEDRKGNKTLKGEGDFNKWLGKDRTAGVKEPWLIAPPCRGKNKPVYE